MKRNIQKKAKPPVVISKRAFYKTVLHYEVLSEEPLGDVSLEDVFVLCTDGPCSGRFLGRKVRELDGRQAARALENQGSDAAFFRLTDRGEDADGAAS